MVDPNIVKFGTRAFRIKSAKWDDKNHVGIVHFEDDNGIDYSTFCHGMTKQEQRQAIVDAVIAAYKKSEASKQSAEMLKQLAIACGNHPYEDG